MEYYFKTEKLSVGYNGKPLIQNIDIGIGKGQILTLIGPNGAGKSTILKSIVRQLSLIDGKICLDGTDIYDISGKDLSQKMSVVLTDRLQGELMTCEDVVATGRYPYTGHFGILSEDDYRVVEEAMELVHITEIKDMDFTRISDGQRQRVMLARCLCQEPEIIILDEPTSYLDIRYKLEFLSTLEELKKRKKLTVIMSLHELELAQKISDKILCVKGRYVEKFGSPDEIFGDGYIAELFDLTAGSFDDESGNAELIKVEGEPEVFVIAGNGLGRRLYHRLQREGIAFATGILYKNDLDYPVAKALAVKLIEAEAFEPMSDEAFEEAKKILAGCKKVICCKDDGDFGTYEQKKQRIASICHSTGQRIGILAHFMWWVSTYT